MPAGSFLIESSSKLLVTRTGWFWAISDHSFWSYLPLSDENFTLLNLNIWSQLANLDKILCVASLGWGKGCIRFWGRLDKNSGFHSNRKPPLTYSGENDVSTFSQLFWIRFFLYLQVTKTCIRSQMSTNFGQIRPLTIELAAFERLKNFP